MDKKLTFDKLVTSINEVHGQLTAQAGKAVNISLTLRNWMIGCYIAEYELNGADRAKYGDKLLAKLSIELEKQNTSSCGKRQLYQYIRFYQVYPGIVRTVSAQFQNIIPEWVSIDDKKMRSATAQSELSPQKVLQNLSYSHIEQLISIDDDKKRTFYEIECIKGVWSVRELKRQIGSLYYERSELSKDKKKLAELVKSGAESADAQLNVRDPFIFEFLGLRAKEVMGESDLEDQLLDKLFVSKYQLELPKQEEMQKFIEEQIKEAVDY